MAKPRKPLEMQKGNLTVLQQERKRQEEKMVQTGKNQLRPPAWLIDDVAIAEFKRLVKELKKIDIIGNLDLDNLGAYANAFANYVKATQEMKEQPLVVRRDDGFFQNPLIKVQKLYAEEMRKFAALCGLTIDSRLKVATTKVNKQEETIETKFGNI